MMYMTSGKYRKSSSQSINESALVMVAIMPMAPAPTEESEIQPPASLSAGDHPARGLALSALHLELSRR
jgi:hypothetical protein